MANVGEIVVAARSIIPDAPQTLPAPSGFAAVQGVVASTTLPAGSYAVSVTLLTLWGETTPTSLSAVTVDATHGISVTGSQPIGAAKLRVYYGIGTVNQYQDFTSQPASTITAVGIAGVPPTTNRAYLPDSDGGYASAYTLYQWLNEALDKATDISGGIQDYTGVSTTVGQPLYTLINKWIKTVTGTFDGYLIFGGDKRSIFRRSPITAISAINVSVTMSPNNVIEMYPQPNRTAAVLSLTTAPSLSATATIANYSVTSGALFTNFGMALLGGNTASPELVYYSASSAGVLNNLVRGLGGTQPQIWPTGTQINELNLWFSGYRRAVKHSVGDSSKTILIPPGWESLLPRYIEARYRQSEHEWKVASDLMSSFEKEIKSQQSAYKQLSGPVQIPDDYYSGIVGDAFGSGAGGKWIVP